MFQRDLATLYVRMGDTSEKANNLQDAMVKYQRSAEIYKQIADLDVRNTLARRDLAQSLKSVGMTAIKLGRKEIARRELERSLALLNELRSQNAIGKWDEKLLDEVQLSLTKL